MNEVDETYQKNEITKQNISQVMYNLYAMDPEKRTKLLAKYGATQEDFAALSKGEGEKVEKGPQGTEAMSAFEDPIAFPLALLGAALTGGTALIAPFIYGTAMGKAAGGATALSGGGPILQDIAEFIGNLANPEGEAKILERYGPEVLAELQQAAHAEGNVELLKKIQQGLLSGEIVTGKAPLNLLHKLKGLLKEPNDTELRAIKAGFVSPETEELLFKAQSRRINRLNKMLTALKKSTPEEQQALLPKIADEFMKYQQLQTTTIRQVGKEGSEVARAYKHEWSANDLADIHKFASTDPSFAESLDRVINKPLEDLAAQGYSRRELEKARLEWQHRTDLFSQLSDKMRQSEHGQKLLKRINQLEDILKGPLVPGKMTLEEAKTMYKNAHPEWDEKTVLQWAKDIIKDQSGSSQLISDISSRLYTFGKGLIEHEGGITQALYKAEVNAQMMNPAITLRKLVTDVLWIPLVQRPSQSIAIGMKHGIDAGSRTLIASLMAFKNSIPEAFRIAKMSVESGVPEFERMLGLKSRVFGEEAFDATDPGRVANYLGGWYSLGSRAVMSADQFAKVLAHRSSKFMYAFNTALQEIEASGKFNGVDLINRAEKLAYKYMDEMPEWLLKAQAEDMYKTTFTDSNGLIRGLTYIATEYPALRILFPYIRTPINLYKSGLQMTPLGLPMSFLEQKGSLERSAMQAKAAMGSAMALFLAYEVMQGNITGSGPVNPAHYNMNLPEPYTMWGFSYKHLGPIGTYMALIADATEGIANGDPMDKNHVTESVIEALATSLTNAPTMSGLINLTGVADSVRQGKIQAGENLVGNILGGFIPAPVRMAAQIEDPVYKDARGAVDRFRKNLPMFNKDIPPYRKWDATPQYLPPGVQADGTPPSTIGVIANMLNPLPYHATHMDDLDRELKRLHIEFDRTPAMTDVTGKMTPLTQEQRDKWALLSGQMEIGGMTQRDRGLNIINSEAYQNLQDDEYKKQLLKANHFHYVGTARSLIVQDILNQQAQIPQPAVSTEPDYVPTPSTDPAELERTAAENYAKFTKSTEVQAVPQEKPAGPAPDLGGGE